MSRWVQTADSVASEPDQGGWRETEEGAPGPDPLGPNARNGIVGKPRDFITCIWVTISFGAPKSGTSKSNFKILLTKMSVLFQHLLRPGGLKCIREDSLTNTYCWILEFYATGNGRNRTGKWISCLQVSKNKKVNITLRFQADLSHNAYNAKQPCLVCWDNDFLSFGLKI